MIDPLNEQIVPLANAAAFCPRRRGGKKTHVSCLYRWTTTGCRGVRLEFLQCGGTRCTSKEALARFFNNLTAQHSSECLTIRMPVARERAIRKAEAELEGEL